VVADLLWQEVREAGSGLLVATHDAAVAERADLVIEVGAAAHGSP
jgi:predicted ABC-type transport system involved in lysophospholipase L1 biosynthesis ATPase subunit